MRFLATSILFLVSLPAVGSAAGESGPEWIWSAAPRALGTPVLLEKSFRIRSPAAAATLRLAVDFCEASVWLDGKELGRAGPSEPLLRLEVGARLGAGEHRIVVEARSSGGPPAVAVGVTQLRGDDSLEVLRSNSSWRTGSEEGGTVAFGRVDVEPWWSIEARPGVSVFDDYNQSEAAGGEGGAHDPARFQLPPGFRLELVRWARDGEGSWVSLAIDPRGRYIIGREKRGLLRMQRPAAPNGEASVENLVASVLGVQGLLWAHGSLFAYANESRGLYRLRDTNGDDSFDDVRLLQSVPGKPSSHGMHQVVLGPDGKIYVINGDGTRLPQEFQSRVPATHEFGSSRRPLKGHVVRTDVAGKTWEVFTSGLRNPFGLAFNADGELFTYDADSEASTGLPWYRPTRVLHLVSGADYGWRSGDPVWPADFPESLPATLNVGKGSPTALAFAAGSQFPPRYRRALCALDWAYGRILAVHLVPQGASYAAHAEVVVRGRPLNVVDLAFDTDGSMVFVTGGEGTRSSLYRLSYVGAVVPSPEETIQQGARRGYSAGLRVLRRELESLHSSGARGAVETAWPFLEHPDPFIRHAARVAIEHQPVRRWQARALEETRAGRALPALLALARVGPSKARETLWKKLGTISLKKLSPPFQRMAVRVAGLLESGPGGRYGRADETSEPSREARVFRLRPEVLTQFEPLFPSGESGLDRELCRLLARHGSGEVVGKTLRLLAAEPPQIDAFHYLLILARVQQGWSPRLRGEYFRLVRGARLFLGDRGLPAVVRALEETALESVPETERAPFKELLEDVPSLEPELGATGGARAFVRKWVPADFEGALDDQVNPDGRARGAAVFREAQCSQCHRLGPLGRAYGPDLTALNSRFGRREILDAVLTPSKQVPSRQAQHVIALRDGRVITGRVVWNGFRASELHIASDPMRLEQVTKISKHDIVSYEESPVSPMPEGLLDTFSREEVLDLLAFLQSGGR